MKPGWRSLAAGSIVAAGFLFISGLIALNLWHAQPGTRDFIEYWAAEQQLVHHANPYDGEAILHLERPYGFDKLRPEFWYSPPQTLVLALPLGFLSAQMGLILWTVALFTCLAVSIWLLWRILGRPNSLLFLLGFAFAPAVVCLMAGQISLVMLLAVMLFLHLHRTRPFLAGMALLPCTLKPHLFVPFAAAMLVWLVARKSYRVLGGFLTASLAAYSIVLAFDGQIWSQYSHMMKTEGMLYEYVPILSQTLRLLISPQLAWLQFVPDVIGCCWAVWYFWTRRNHWDWMDHGMILLLVSAICRAYGWIFDESVLLPAVLAGVYRSRLAGRSLWPIAICGSIALIEAFASVKVASPYYLWTTPAWLACYLYATVKADSRVAVQSRLTRNAGPD